MRELNELTLVIGVNVWHWVSARNGTKQGQQYECCLYTNQLSWRIYCVIAFENVSLTADSTGKTILNRDISLAFHFPAGKRIK